VVNSNTKQVTHTERTVRVSLMQAWSLRHMLHSEYDTELYLLTGKILRGVIATEELDREGVASSTEFAPIHSSYIHLARPPGSVAPTRAGLSFLRQAPPRPQAPPNQITFPSQSTVVVEMLSIPHTASAGLYPSIPQC